MVESSTARGTKLVLIVILYIDYLLLSDDMRLAE